MKILKMSMAGGWVWNSKTTKKGRNAGAMRPF
jgi:hypothetical protein